MAHTFLVEIGSEELPPKSLKTLSEAFAHNIIQALENKKLKFKNFHVFATPRRLAIIVENLDEATPIEENPNWGPPANIAFDQDGNPTKAAQAFAAKNGLSLSGLKTQSDGKQDKLCCMVTSGGESTKAIIGHIVVKALADLPIKKRMRWGSHRIEFVRPVQWVVLMIDGEALPESILGIQAGTRTRGHRFHANDFFNIESIVDYEVLLETQAWVIPSFEKRRALIQQQIETVAIGLNGKVVIDEDLLEEVTALVEWPVALAGKFDEKFLHVPSEALILSMKEHQKYFYVVDDQGKLLPNFITIANIASKDVDQVIDGNERVIRPRLSDAAFFFEKDKSITLENRREKLKQVMFQAKLGSMSDKTERIRRLAVYIAEELQADQQQVERAAQLCKADLVSSMVYEFPEMQGIAGSHYARNDGETEEVASAILEHYMPKFAGDDVPRSTFGAIIAIADRIDTVTGIFGIGEKPTGSKDPFALRRASLGILRILVEKSYPLDLEALVDFAADGFSSLPQRNSVVDDVISYCMERFRAWYLEKDIAVEIFLAVQAKQLTTPLDFDQRINAVAEFTKLPEALSLAEANKRVSNILAKQADEIGRALDQNLLLEKAEQQLAIALERARHASTPLLDDRAYEKALCSLADLKKPIDTFFDNVMVMTEDSLLRKNRLTLLSQLRSVFLEVADISYLVMKG